MASATCCSAPSASSVAGAAAAAASSLAASSRSTSSRSAVSVSRRNFDASSALAGLRISCDRRRCSVAARRRTPFVVRAEAEAGGEEAGGGGLPEPRAPESPVAAVAPSTSPRKRSKGAAKPLKSQRVLLRFLWLEKNIGISLDQVIPGHGVVPLCPYFFWPRKDAWEELKAKLDSKKWISRKRTIVLLNQTTDIINLWQANASNSQ